MVGSNKKKEGDVLTEKGAQPPVVKIEACGEKKSAAGEKKSEGERRKKR